MTDRIAAALLALSLCACGSAAPLTQDHDEPAEQTASVGGEAEAEAPPEPPAPTALCASQLAEDEELTGCALGAGRTMPDGVRVDVLQISGDYQGDQTTVSYLLFRDADRSQLVRIVSEGRDGNGEESSVAELGELTGERSHVGIEATLSVYIRGCTGDPSCFDDDSNLERTDFVGYRVACVPRAEVADDDFEPEYDDEGEEISVLYVCQRDEFTPSE